MTWAVRHGDCRELMAGMDEASVDAIVTDPPYELGFMGRAWDRSGIAYDVAMWRAALRVLKPGGHLLAFGGSRTYHRMACAIEDAGFDIRDQIMWIYGSGFPKSGLRDGKGTCLKPAHEPIVMARKPLVGSVAVNEARYGTGAINIDACRVGNEERIASFTSFAPCHRDGLGAPGTQEARRGTQSPPQTYVGRWPANVIHDGSDEVVAGFPETASGGYPPAGGVRSHNATYGDPSTRGEPVFGTSSGSAARFFYCAKASAADRDEGLHAFDPQAFVQFQTGNGESGRASSLSEGRETQYRNTHPTVKPEALMRHLVRLVTPARGTVLDPFTGSGSTGKAAVLEGLGFIGCELTAEYLPIARARIAAAECRAAQQAEDSARAAAEAQRQRDLFAA